MAAALVAFVAFMPMAANAVHTEGLFELDGNILDNPSATGQDWSSFQAPALAGDTPPVAKAFVTDGFNGVDDTIYFGGGSQNNNDIPSWKWSCGSVSTKSDIEHAFASAYIHSNQLYLYFGADRYDPTGGTTNVGFWFLQNGGALQGGTGCPDTNPATNNFSGQHVDGDLFVFAEFSGGGGDSAVSMYEWQSGGLHLLASKTSGSFCSADDSICALTNSQTIPSSWPYSDNQGSSPDGQVLQGGFVEGGINLSSIYAGLGKDLPCVNRFLAQTGSSHPDTGVLEDFAGGSFNICSKLIVDKVAPSGVQTAFPFSVSGPNAYSDSFQLADASPPHDSGQIKSGTYTVAETPGDPAVWNAPSVACLDQGSNPVAYGPNGALSIAPGATVTCTFTNTKKPQLTVVKKIVGGNGTTDAFDVKVDGSTKIDDAVSTAPAGTSSGAFAVSAASHSVTETLGDGSTAVPAGWQVSYSGDCDSNGQVSVQNDQSKSCTITNSKLPRLTVVKQIQGGDGSTFDISVGGTKVLDDAGNGASDTRSYSPGSYSVSETFGNGGAIGSAWAVGFSGDCDASGAVSLAYGDEKTCTVINKRKPKLTVVKVIEGGNGASFDLAVNGSTVLDNVGGSGGQVTNTYDVGTSYSVSETLGNGAAVDPAVWETSMSGDCSGSLAAGDDKACTVTNKRKPKLTVVKRIIGGDGSSFDISVGATKVLDDAGDGASDTRTYAPGSYPVSETLADGSAIPGGWSTSFSSDCAGAAVSLAYGDDKTCTITNSKLPLLKVVKNVVGGVKSSGDFEISVAGNQPSPSQFAGSADGTVVTLLPGGYDVSEQEDSHYVASYSSDCKDGSIDYGDAKTCTITNTRKPASIEIEKVASPTSLPEPGGSVTFSIKVRNTSPADTVTLTELNDSIYGDLFARGDCDELKDLQLAPDNGSAGGLDEATCSFAANVTGNAGDSHHNIATVTGHDEDNRPVTDDDFADVELTDVAPSIEVTKSASPETIPEPGGLVEFTVEVQNTSVSSDPVTITSLVDDPDGAGPAAAIDLNGKGSCHVPQTIQPGGKYVCKFTRSVTGNAGDEKTDVVTASGQDDDGHEVSDHDDATVTLTDVPSSIAVVKTASPTSMPAPGGPVTFTVVVKNTSAVDSVTIDKLVDNVYGDLAGKGTCAALIGKVLQPDDHGAGGADEASCSFSAAVNGPGGSTHTDVVTVDGHDDDGKPVSAHDDATVAITPLIDLYVTKNDLPDPVQLNGRLTYTIVVGNNGPDAATEVTLADPLPAETTFVSVSTTKGTCTGGALISCSLGTVAKGETVTITLVVTANKAGTITNTVTVVGKEPESNTANNRATAPTLVVAPVVRKPQRAVCDSFTATPKSLTVGKRSMVVVRVTASGKPAKGRLVLVKGAGISKSGRTNARGLARIVVKPRRAGIVTITVPQKIVCGAKRIGAVGAFQPPVTG
ncbi:MAG TPA: DUF11 domain-containing protein [Gaiellaceae bacterium]|nr:DUF11 domain-containing protein [Gaiellaceae bacterium]